MNRMSIITIRVYNRTKEYLVDLLMLSTTCKIDHPPKHIFCAINILPLPPHPHRVIINIFLKRITRFFFQSIEILMQFNIDDDEITAQWIFFALSKRPFLPQSTLKLTSYIGTQKLKSKFFFEIFSEAKTVLRLFPFCTYLLNKYFRI